MKKVITFFALVLSVFSSYADYTTPNTSVSWNLNDLVTNSGGVVTFSGGNYFVNSNLTVAASDTIKILSNATVKLAYNSAFNIRGTIIINPPDSVKFTSIDTTQKFTEMRMDTSSSSQLKKLIFEYSLNGLRIFDCSPLISNCIIRFNCIGNISTTAPAINLFRSNAVISNCQIYRNYKVAIGGGSNIANAPQILFNNIYENNFANANASQINLGASGSSTTVIRGNTITGLFTNAGGIATLPSGTLSIVIENNIIKKNRYGIAIQSSGNAIIRNNIIDSNNIQGIPNLGGSGINFLGSGVTAQVSKNSIRGNLWGITIQSSAKPVMGNLSNPDTNYIGMNYIYGNKNNDTIYDLYNNTADSIKAENNFWGTGNLDTIEAHIFHKTDNPALGFVDYMPVYIPVGIQPVNSEISTQFSLHDAYPNPFNPSTNIRFDIAKTSDVKIVIYDIRGLEADVLINQRMNAGNYSLNYNASKLASGVYFLKLAAGGFFQTKKIVLLK